MAVRVTGPAETVVAFVPPGRLMSLNDREHWRPHARRVAVWRDVARVAALAGRRALLIESDEQWIPMIVERLTRAEAAADLGAAS